MESRTQQRASSRRAERERKAREQAGGPGPGGERRDTAALIDAAGRVLDAAGQPEYWENATCAAERRREGHWLLETEETELSAVEAVRAYQDLWRVEAAFRWMKDVLELRPV